MSKHDVFTALAVVAAGVLVALHDLPSEAFLTLLGGVLLKSPLAASQSGPQD